MSFYLLVTFSFPFYDTEVLISGAPILNCSHVCKYPPGIIYAFRLLVACSFVGISGFQKERALIYPSGKYKHTMLLKYKSRATYVSSLTYNRNKGVALPINYQTGLLV